MKQKHSFSILSILFLMLAPVSHAENEKISELKTMDGKVFQNVRITKVEPDGIRIIHESGIVKIPIESVPDEIQKKFNLNAEAADEHRKKIREHQRKAEERNKRMQLLEKLSLNFYGEIFQVTEGGVLLRHVRYSDGTKEERKVPYKVQTGGPSALNPKGARTFETRYKSEWIPKVRRMESWPIYVECDTSKYVDGDSFSAVVYADGTFAYTNVQGSRKTIPAYTTNPAKILRKFGMGP